MKTSELINNLNAIMQEHGDLNIVNRIFPQCNIEATVSYKRIPKDRRQSAHALYNEGNDNPEQKGEKVLVI